MVRAAKAKPKDPLMERAVEYFAGRSHNAWRKRLLATDPKQKGKPRMRMRGGTMVDVNQPWSKLDAKAKADNAHAARAAYAAVKKFPADREAAADYIHREWIKRNKGDASQPKALFRPYDALPEVEKDKDRAHVDRMKRAIAAVSKPRRKQKTRTPRAPATKTVRIDAATWRRLEAAAKSLSRSLGRSIDAQDLLVAGAEAVAAMVKTKSRKR